MINTKAAYSQTGEGIKKKKNDTQSTFNEKFTGELYKTECSFRHSKSALYDAEATRRYENLQCAIQIGFTLSIKHTPDFEDFE